MNKSLAATIIAAFIFAVTVTAMTAYRLGNESGSKQQQVEQFNDGYLTALCGDAGTPASQQLDPAQCAEDGRN